jgi:hypothetical protein
MFARLTIDKSIIPGSLYHMERRDGLKKMRDCCAVLMLTASADLKIQKLFAMDTFFELTAYGEHRGSLEGRRSALHAARLELAATTPKVRSMRSMKPKRRRRRQHANFWKSRFRYVMTTHFRHLVLRLRRQGLLHGEERVPEASEIAALLKSAAGKKASMK